MNIRLFILFGFAAFWTFPLLAQTDPMPSPSGALLCLSGKIYGQEGGPACAVYTRDFFNLWIPSRAACDEDKTSIARINYLWQEMSDPNTDLYGPLMVVFGGCVDMPPFPPPMSTHGPGEFRD